MISDLSHPSKRIKISLYQERKNLQKRNILKTKPTTSINSCKAVKKRGKVQRNNYKEFVNKKDEISKTFNRLKQVNNIIENDDPFEGDLVNQYNQELVKEKNILKASYFAKISEEKKQYNLEYDRAEKEDEEMAQMINFNPEGNGTISNKEMSRMIARSLVVNKYNKKFRLSHKTRSWNIKF
mmetsp:Transcript_10290/g.9092  ORF Transcript_10290/g.9092 Transcript_10290/m.9092 type:complete len:182 (+) Transcript_10290:229-774(+)